MHRERDISAAERLDDYYSPVGVIIIYCKVYIDYTRHKLKQKIYD